MSSYMYIFSRLSNLKDNEGLRAVSLGSQMVNNFATHAAIGQLFFQYSKDPVCCVRTRKILHRWRAIYFATLSPIFASLFLSPPFRRFLKVT